MPTIQDLSFDQGLALGFIVSGTSAIKVLSRPFANVNNATFVVLTLQYSEIPPVSRYYGAYTGEGSQLS